MPLYMNVRFYGRMIECMISDMYNKENKMNLHDPVKS